MLLHRDATAFGVVFDAAIVYYRMHRAFTGDFCFLAARAFRALAVAIRQRAGWKTYTTTGRIGRTALDLSERRGQQLGF